MDGWAFKIFTLTQSLLVRDNLLDVFQLGSWQCQVHGRYVLKLRTTGMLLHQIIYRTDSAIIAVFHRQDAVFAQALLHRLGDT